MRKTSTSLALVTLALTLAACDSNDDKTYTPVGSNPTGTPTPAVSTTPAPTGVNATPTPTAAPGVSPTPAVSSTPVATPTTAPAPSATPSPSASPAPTPTPGLAGRVDLSVPAGSSVVVTAGQTCILCDVTNKDSVLDPDWANFATASLQVGLLAAGGFGDLTVQVNLPQVIDPSVPLPNASGGTTLPSNAGFVVSFPDPSLLSLSVLPSIEIAVLNGDAVVGDVASYGYGFFESLALGSVVQDINNARVYLGTAATGPYDAIRLTFTASLADVLLNVNLHQAAIAGVPGSIAGDF